MTEQGARVVREEFYHWEKEISPHFALGQAMHPSILNKIPEWESGTPKSIARFITSKFTRKEIEDLVKDRENIHVHLERGDYYDRMNAVWNAINELL